MPNRLTNEAKRLASWVISKREVINLAGIYDRSEAFSAAHEILRLAALAAKAPQGVPHSLVSQLKDYIWQLREVGSHRCIEIANDIERMLDADASPKLPAAGPVSDDTIHHGMVPPGTPRSSEAPCMTCGRPKPVIYAVNVQTCPGCFQPFDTREAAAPKLIARTVMEAPDGRCLANRKEKNG